MGVHLEQESVSDLSESGGRTLFIRKDNPIRISTGHCLLHHDGKCSRPHGINYEISVEVTGSHTQDGWVVDKGDITSVIDDWDHRFLLENDDPLIDAFEQSGDGDSLVVLEHPPTAEVMELVLERKLLETLPESVSDISVAVRETSEICAGATH
ncbi:6-carboxy-5,6,7,8-tetrahydropterin synthase [Halorubrum ezzemoulense DSM 17463]|uniref:6-carboxy-5,6,7,8-tetrahydropterin synthase n=1 Tax=Halorubrum ezzemoulense DSM 17463 TaxID=1121945 RepID=A0A1X4H821_HALEZ|nr:6-carboxy-5,6,7,8-tetrahydropterin synthase [Halorubrum ezzemoulense DSM 17463]